MGTRDTFTGTEEGCLRRHRQGHPRRHTAFLRFTLVFLLVSSLSSLQASRTVAETAYP
jgi:hypothetical protein